MTRKEGLLWVVVIIVILVGAIIAIDRGAHRNAHLRAEAERKLDAECIADGGRRVDGICWRFQ